MEVSKQKGGGEVGRRGRLADQVAVTKQSETPFTIKVSDSEGLPPTEIYLSFGSGNDDVDVVVNESIWEAETPAHGNLSETESTIVLKHPHAPKNKRQMAPRKFTFDELTPKNSIIESRDERTLQTDEDDTPEQLESNRDDTYQKSRKKVQTDDNDDSMNEIDNQEIPHVKSPEEMEHEEGAYWFAECAVVPQIDGQNSFPTVPFDEEPDPNEANLFCNRPPSTTIPHEGDESNNLGAIHMMEQEDATIQDSEKSLEERKIEELGGSSLTSSSEVTEPMPKVGLPLLSPKTAAVMALVEITANPDDLEMAPSDELENRCTSEDAANTPKDMEIDEHIAMMEADEDIDEGNKEDDQMMEQKTSKEQEMISIENPSDEGEGHVSEASEGYAESERAEMEYVPEPQAKENDNVTKYEVPTTQALPDIAPEEEVEGDEEEEEDDDDDKEEEASVPATLEMSGTSFHQEVSLSEDGPIPAKIEIPSVMSHAGDSAEEIEAPPSSTPMGDLRLQLDHLRVSEALEAVSQSFKDHTFVGTEFCGQQIMDWFGSVGRKE